MNTRRVKGPSEDDLRKQVAWMQKAGLGENSYNYSEDLSSDDPAVLLKAYKAWLLELEDDLTMLELTGGNPEIIRQKKVLAERLKNKISILEAAKRIKHEPQRRKLAANVRKEIEELVASQK